jgi:hypothetical protein
MRLRGSVLVLAVAVASLLAGRSALGDDMSDIADWCATKATAPSSVIICSDPELRRMAVIRNKIFADARAALSVDKMNELTASQNHWIHEYTTACGAPVNGRPVTLPVSQGIVDCYKKAGRERVTELIRYVRTDIPNYQIPIVTGSTAPIPAGSGVATAKGNTTFQVVGIPSNDVLNVRAQPTSQSRIVGMLPPSSGGIVYEDRRSDDGHWFLIRYGDTTGWVASRYLREESPPNTVALPLTAPAPPASPPSADQAARQQAAAEERERLQKHAAQEKLKGRLDDLGFKLLEPVDLSLDWKAYVANQTKVALVGTYLEANDVEELSTPDNKDQPTIRLYTNDASRAARKQCWNAATATSRFPCVRWPSERSSKDVYATRANLTRKRSPASRCKRHMLSRNVRYCGAGLR